MNLIRISITSALYPGQSSHHVIANHDVCSASAHQHVSGYGQKSTVMGLLTVGKGKKLRKCTLHFKSKDPPKYKLLQVGNRGTFIIKELEGATLQCLLEGSASLC